MDISTTQVPIWISILFILSFGTIPILLFRNAISSVYKKTNPIKKSLICTKITLFYFSYFIIVALISLSGFFATNTLPPRILLTTTIPLLLFYLLYVQKTNWFKLVFKQIKLEELVFIHVFRFVGVFFFIGYYYDVLPKTFAFIGGAGDIASAIVAILVFIALKKQVKLAKLSVFIFNFIGLLDIFSVLTTAIIINKEAIENNTSGLEQFGTFPFSWIPAFAPATIIFLHLLIFKKLKENQ